MAALRLFDDQKHQRVAVLVKSLSSQAYAALGLSAYHTAPLGVSPTLILYLAW